MQRIKAFWADQKAATAIEYGLIVAVMSLVIVAGIGLVGGQVEYLFNHQDSELQKAFSQGDSE